ncbi:MAG: TetR/AcrR family transcriptional regulator [Micropepsaceae bacterium]
MSNTPPPHPEERPKAASRRTQAAEAAAPAARRYGGVSMAARQANRRDRLIMAAIQVSARTGREGATVAAICAEAGLTARYFYESFPNRDALFLAAFQRVQDELFARITPHAAGRDPVKGALVGFFSTLAEYPGPARVFLVELDEHEAEMKALGRAAAARFGALFAPDAPPGSLAQAGAAGAIIQIARRWVQEGFRETPEDVAAICLPFARASKAAR